MMFETFVLPLLTVLGAGDGDAAVPDFAAFADAVTLREEIDCVRPPATARFSDHPAGASRVEKILGAEARVLPRGPAWSFMSFTVGKGIGVRGLEAGAAYVLSVEYPEDVPRSMFILNRGCETQRGLYTGAALGDQLGGWVNTNPESLRVPLSRRYERWRQYFHLHHRYPDRYQPRDAGSRTQTPADGFRVIIVHLDELQAPVSAGAACRTIRLYEVTKPIALRYEGVPAGLPRRHVFWREEMADNVVHYLDAPAAWGVPDDKTWYDYKMRLMRFLGLRTFSKDLLEFGHTQGWKVGDPGWFVPSRPHLEDRWTEILDLCARYGFDVIPYYEYYGSTGPRGLGRQKRCVSLKGTRSYTGLHWVEKFNADVTDPETLADAKRLLAETMVKYKDRVKFAAAWFRARPSALPISFADRVLREFESATERTARSVTREKLRNDGDLMAAYRDWWLERRKAFFTALGRYLRGAMGDGVDLLFTWDPTEPGWTLSGPRKYIVTDDTAAWTRITKALQERGVWWFPLAAGQCAAGERYLQSMTAPRRNWGADEWSNASPEADPVRYQEASGVVLTHPIHRMYSLTERSLNTFRSGDDLAVIRHYALNENAPNHRTPDAIPTGYFVADMERSGPFSMMAEARAVALGDPNYLGYLASNSWNHGFPRYARRFYGNYLSLPALPSTVVAGAAREPDVVVRKITGGEHGVWYAIVNVGYHPVRTEVKLEARGTVIHAPTGAELAPAPGVVRLRLDPCELMALRVRCGSRGS
jgi:hypothetical protein